MESTGTRSVALCVIRGFLGFFSTSTSNLTLKCLLRGLSVRVLEYFVIN